MDQARDIQRNITIDASELVYTGATGPFECIGCTASMDAVAVGSTKVMPHFRVRRPGHEPTCNVGGDAVPVKPTDPLEDARSERLGGVAIPYRLVRPTVREEVDPDSGTEPQQRSTRGPADPSDSEEKPGLREATTSTIRPFCRTYIQYPNLRSRLRINIPEIEADFYQFAFKRLEQDKIVAHPQRRIFYAQVAWRTEPDFTADAAEITLYAGERDPERPARVSRGYRVVIDWSSWNPKTRSALRREIAAARRDARDQAGTAVKTWLFFLGTQDPSDDAILRVNHHSDYVFLTAEIASPTNPVPKPSKTPRRPKARGARPSPRRRRLR
ncbi:hypothetical protein [Nocardia sp. NPDC004722]